jgi:hypothetical protein
MENSAKIVGFKELVNDLKNKNRVQLSRFDIFKGTEDQSGKIVKIKSVGSAYIREGLKTYTVHLKTLLKDSFYLLPNSKDEVFSDYVILTREPAQNSGRKYFWNNVGDGNRMTGMNSGLMSLSWDLFADDLYMNVAPIKVTEVEANSQKFEVAS